MKNSFDVIRKNLNSNVEHVAKFTSPQTVNSWGIVILGDKCCKCDDEVLWVANNGSDTLVKYSKKGMLLQVVNVTGQAPTGLVVNNTHTFQNALLITATENGTIEIYNPLVNANNTIVVVTTPDAVYKGLAIADNKLYVANFHSGNVEVYDGNFTLLSTFTDPALVNSGYAPFNIIARKNRIYVTFAKQDEDKHDDVKGDGFGYIDIFSPVGSFLHRFINREPLNAPWGLLFSKCGNFLYVGNFGDGRINIFDKNGVFISPLHDKNGNILVLDGLWGIVEGKRGIYFASGIDLEENGLIGLLE
jgi:uncharacterized protein (TIGR03118 family)